MAASKASLPLPADSHADATMVRARQATTSVPGSLPKAPRGLSFDSAERSSIRALSQAEPLPRDPGADPEADIDTTLFRRDDPDLEELEALRRNVNQGRTDQAAAIPDPPPTPRFAPPLPIPPFEAVEHPTGVRRRANVAPPPVTDFTRPQTMRRPSLPRRRRFPWGGVAILAVAAVIGAVAGWVATPYVHPTSGPAAETTSPDGQP